MPVCRAASWRETPSSTKAIASRRRACAASPQRFAAPRNAVGVWSSLVIWTAALMIRLRLPNQSISQSRSDPGRFPEITGESGLSALGIIAQRGRNALVLVHHRELLTQWVERPRTFLDIDPKEIGVIGGGRRKPTGVIDVALIQSLVRRGEVFDLLADYGHLIVDGCHHLSAVSFELVARRARGRFVLGLSATVARKDGHYPIIFMQCGPVRHRVDARAQAAARGINHRAKHRSTEFQLPPPLAALDRLSMPAVYAAITQDEPR